MSNAITDNTRGYESLEDRNRAVSALRRRGFNYFVFYKDVQSNFALLYGNADWVPEGQHYINR